MKAERTLDGRWVAVDDREQILSGRFSTREKALRAAEQAAEAVERQRPVKLMRALPGLVMFRRL